MDTELALLIFSIKKTKLNRESIFLLKCREPRAVLFKSSVEIIQINIDETKVPQGFGFMRLLHFSYYCVWWVFSKSKMFAIIEVLCSTVEKKCMPQREA